MKIKINKMCIGCKNRVKKVEVDAKCYMCFENKRDHELRVIKHNHALEDILKNN